jgi:hypothetical protein
MVKFWTKKHPQICSYGGYHETLNVTLPCRSMKSGVWSKSNPLTRKQWNGILKEYHRLWSLHTKHFTIVYWVPFIEYSCMMRGQVMSFHILLGVCSSNVKKYIIRFMLKECHIIYSCISHRIIYRLHRCKNTLSFTPPHVRQVACFKWGHCRAPFKIVRSYATKRKKCNENISFHCFCYENNWHVICKKIIFHRLSVQTGIYLALG